MTGVRKIRNGYQGVFGSGGPGQTKFFPTAREAAAWSYEKRLAYRNVTKRKSRVLPTKSFDASVKLPVGVTYSHGKWWARSPSWYSPRVSKVFTEHAHGRREALRLALEVAKRWLWES